MTATIDPYQAAQDSTVSAPGPRDVVAAFGPAAAA